MITGKYAGCLAAGLLASAMSVQTAEAVQMVDLDFDLFGGTVFVNPEPNYSSNGIPLGQSFTIDPNDSNPDNRSIEIWIDFIDGQTGAKQHLEIADDGNDPPQEDFGVSVGGTDSDIPENQPASFEVTLTGVMGDLIGGPTFTKTDGNCLIDSCNSFTFPVDLTDTSFMFHDIHIVFTPTGTSPVTINRVQFGFAVNGFTQTTSERDDLRRIIGTWPLPEPSVLTLFGFGLLGLAAMGWREKQLARTRTS